VIRVTDVGWKARRLVDGASAAAVVAALSRSLYLEVAGEIVWLGPPGSTLHGRALVAGDPPNVQGATRIDTSFDLRAAREWRPHELPASVTPEILGKEGRRLANLVDRLGRPDGFGALIVARRPAFPLDRATDNARIFLEACARDDTRAAAAIGEQLLGLGPGLTPAGDDLVGGAVFARRLVAGIIHRRDLVGRGLVPRRGSRRGTSPRPTGFLVEPASAEGWREAAAKIRARAAERTHRISAVLLGDLLEGEGYAPLHDLTLALARSDTTVALDAAVRLVRIGHSSGWDILTGFLGALGALPGA
jgi:hypothetical protein